MATRYEDARTTLNNLSGIINNEETFTLMIAAIKSVHVDGDNSDEDHFIINSIIDFIDDFNELYKIIDAVIILDSENIDNTAY